VGANAVSRAILSDALAPEVFRADLYQRMTSQLAKELSSARF
jgi:hypothetical protein